MKFRISIVVWSFLPKAGFEDESPTGAAIFILFEYKVLLFRLTSEISA